MAPTCAAGPPGPCSYLPDATVAFVDEIFKANSAILNTLLTLLNERLFDNGATRVHVPLLCLVSTPGLRERCSRGRRPRRAAAGRRRRRHIWPASRWLACWLAPAAPFHS